MATYESVHKSMDEFNASLKSGLSPMGILLGLNKITDELVEARKPSPDYKPSEGNNRPLYEVNGELKEMYRGIEGNLDSIHQMILGLGYDQAWGMFGPDVAERMYPTTEDGKRRISEHKDEIHDEAMTRRVQGLMAQCSMDFLYAGSQEEPPKPSYAQVLRRGLV